MIWLIIIAVIVALFGFVIFFGAPYVPSQRRYVRRAFDHLYKVGPRDIVVDVGSGDGLVLRIAAERGAKAIGFEINPLLVLVSRLFSRHPNVTVRFTNFWLAELPRGTTLVYAFSVSRDMKKLEKKVQAEANRLNKEIKLMTLGAHPGTKTEKTFEAYTLQSFRPLQSEKPQV